METCEEHRETMAVDKCKIFECDSVLCLKCRIESGYCRKHICPQCETRLPLIHQCKQCKRYLCRECLPLIGNDFIGFSPQEWCKKCRLNGYDPCFLFLTVFFGVILLSLLFS